MKIIFYITKIVIIYLFLFSNSIAAKSQFFDKGKELHGIDFHPDLDLQFHVHYRLFHQYRRQSDYGLGRFYTC